MITKKLSFLLCVLLAFSLLFSACAEDPDTTEESTEPTTHTVIFDSQGGTPVPSAIVAHAATVPEPTPPTRENSTFLGWYVGDLRWSFTKTVREDVTLVAKWEDSSLAFDYEIVGDHAVIKGLTSAPKESEIIIPDTIKGFPVTAIGDGAFKEAFSDEVKKISLPASITSIGEEAFRNCGSIEIFFSTASITYVGESAFANCTLLREIPLGAGLTELPMNAFMNCKSLVSVLLPSTLTYIDESVFEGCDALTTILIPASVEEVGHSAFRDCRALSTLLFEGDGVAFDAFLTRVIRQKNEAIFDCADDVCLYSENEPTDNGSYWHYDATHSPKVW